MTNHKTIWPTKKRAGLLIIASCKCIFEVVTENKNLIFTMTPLKIANANI